MREIIQIRSGDPFTGVFQKIGPGFTTILMVLIGIYFLYLAQITGLLWRESNESCGLLNGLSELKACQSGYLFNISWSLTMAILFPAIFFVVIRLYDRVPEVVLSIGGEKLLNEIIKKINARWIMCLYLFLPVLWFFYFNSILESESWIWNFSPPTCNGNENCLIVFEAWASISLLGIFTTLYHVFNGLYIICLIRTIIVGNLIAKSICSNPEKFSFAHADGLYGLSKVREFVWDIYLIIGLLTIYVISYIIDKSLIQGQWENAIAISVIFSSAWFLFVCLVQRKITNPIGELIRKIKESELKKLQEKIEHKSRSGEAYSQLWKTKEYIKKLPDSVVELKFWKTLGSVPVFSAVTSAVVVEMFKNADKLSSITSEVIK